MILLLVCLMYLCYSDCRILQLARYQLIKDLLLSRRAITDQVQLAKLAAAVVEQRQAASRLQRARFFSHRHSFLALELCGGPWLELGGKGAAERIGGRSGRRRGERTDGGRAGVRMPVVYAIA